MAETASSWTASEALQLLLCPSRFVCVLAVFKQLKLLLVRRIFPNSAKITMRLIWIERVAEACAKSCIASSSLLGGFGPGVGRDWEGMSGFSLNCTSLVTTESTERTLPSTLRFSEISVWITDPLSHEQRSRCGSQKVLKAVPAGYGRTTLGM